MVARPRPVVRCTVALAAALACALILSTGDTTASTEPAATGTATKPRLPCIGVRTRGTPRGTCWFPVSQRDRRITIAVIGDSHAGSWRSVVAPLAASVRRRAVSLTQHSCPFARVERRYVPPERIAECAAWADAVTAWLRRHPRIRTVFFINSATYDFVPTADKSSFERGVEGYRAAFEALPPSVTDLVVIRDNPHMRPETPACVDRAFAENRPPDECALPRDEALKPDAAATAAASLNDPRVRVADLTRFFCDDRLCPPVIGGVRVYDDSQHLSRPFARTLFRHLRDEWLRPSA
ncbi:MAG: hypothetical protein M3320_03805 [Actinomycetota bacterium]|nr:hypothetical protein [Actinomycetota bacterium]MDQ5807780.1 hypothetical protein [Actinomycetota bacterium]